MNLTPVKSSLINAIGHNPETNQLRVEFPARPATEARPAKGKKPAAEAKPAVPPQVYEYDGVTADEHAALIAAESSGSHFLSNIKGKKTFRKVS